MKKVVFTLAGLLALAIQSVHAGAVGGVKNGSCQNAPRVQFEGGKVAVVAIKSSSNGSDEIEIYDQAGTLVARGYSHSVGGMSGSLGLVIWTPSATGYFTIRVKHSPGVCVYMTN